MEVSEEAWPALLLFLTCASQWRMAPMGGLTGLDYTAVAAVMDMQQIDPADRPQRLTQLQYIERGALDELRKKA